MTETIQAERITLYDLIDKFNFKLSENPAFFREWQINEVRSQKSEVRSCFCNGDLSNSPNTEKPIKVDSFLTREQIYES
ncbi:MAG: hypothetical protein F6K17_00870 [Okeania sp. SIO3C4]|nr:hypothetical protein [Okeania sp. SIO3C4]